jgi:hypothetical protein
LTNLTVSSFSASTIGYANLFTSTVYVGNDNASTNLIRFYGTERDNNPAYSFTVIGERSYTTTSLSDSELIFFKGNDNGAFGTDRIRHFAGAHQFDIINDASGVWFENQDPPVPKISGAVYINGDGRVGVGTTTPSYSLDVSGSFYASTINYAKLYTSTIYVGNDNQSTNMIRFYGTYADGPGSGSGPYSHTVIAERIYEASENSELLLFKGNDNGTNFNDRIRHLAAAHQFDIIAHASPWPDASGNPPTPAINGALAIDNTGRVGINTTSPGATLDVSGTFTSRLKFVDSGTGSGTITIGQTHYGAYLYLQSGFTGSITLPTSGSAPPDGTVVVIINGTSGNISITNPPTVGNTSASIGVGTTRTFAYHTTGPVWIGL